MGAGLGKLAASTKPNRLLAALGVNVVHPMPTAWDYCFGLRPTGGLVEVLLKDGSRIHGWLAAGDSFASSDGKNNDLLVGNVFVPNAEGALAPAEPRRYIYIASGEIRSIAFIGDQFGAQA